MPFLKDPARDEWNSKQDRLSLAVSAVTGDGYWEPGGNPGVYVQYADGFGTVPAGAVCRAAIVHDGMEYPEAARCMFRIGLGPVPGCTVNLDSYPLGPEDRVRRGISGRFDAVVGGRYPGDGLDDTLERAAVSGMRVAVAVTGNVAEEIARKLSAGNEVTVFGNPDIPLVTALYSTCGTVVHLGDCRRGYLHSYAMYHAGVPGRRLVERAGGVKFAPATMEEFLKYFK